MDFLTKFFSKKDDVVLKDEIAKYLKTDKTALENFEKSYKDNVLNNECESPYLFDKSSKQTVNEIRTTDAPLQINEEKIAQLISKITAELVTKTETLCLSDGKADVKTQPFLLKGNFVTQDDLNEIPTALRPQLTGNLMMREIDGDPSYVAVLSNYINMTKATNPEKRRLYYNLFRQGLDILDLDEILYEMLGRNANAMSHWLPQISAAAHKTGFFKIPETKIAKVPLPILQLSRLDYNTLTPATLKIVDDWAMKAFDLDVNKTYFVKTGTFSSKFDFRNAKVTGEKEIRELGSYLLFIQNLACSMAGNLNKHPIYGVSTTNEWVVREYIEDKENNPCIYKGMPLHTEYRVFVDFNTDEILGISPYWKPEVMLQRFSMGDDAQSPHNRHDYIIYKAHEETLMKRYDENKNTVLNEIKKLLPLTTLTGQWSIDIMQNGNDFYLIDMATADTSALSECVPKGLIKRTEENWLPEAKDAL